MQIILNGKEKYIDSNKLLDLLRNFKGHIAVSLNDEIISKNLWQDTNLKDGDKIEVVELVGGG